MRPQLELTDKILQQFKNPTFIKVFVVVWFVKRRDILGPDLHTYFPFPDVFSGFALPSSLALTSLPGSAEETVFNTPSKRELAK